MSQAPNIKHDKDKLCKEAKKDNKNKENNELKILLNKFNKDDILTSIIETPCDGPKRVLKKSNLIKDAINFLTDKFSDLDELILFLQLRYFLTQKKARYWNILEIKDGKRFKKPDLSAEKISYSLKKYFNKYDFSCKIYCEKWEDCIWTVLTLDDETRKPACFITQMKIPLIYYHSLKQKYLFIVKKVLRKTYKGTDIEEFPPIKENIKYIQKLSTNVWKSQKVNSKTKSPLDDPAVTLSVEKENKALNEPQNKFFNKKEISPLDVQFNLASHNVKKKSKTSSNPKSKPVSANENNIFSENLQCKFVSDKGRKVSSNALQSNLVSDDVSKINKISNKPQTNFVGDVIVDELSDDFQRKTVTQNSNKCKIAKKLHRNFCNRGKKEEEPSEDRRNIIVTCNVKGTRKAANKLQYNFVGNNQSKQPLNNLPSNFRTRNVKNRKKIANEPETNSLNENIREESSDLQSKTVAQDSKELNVTKNLQRNFNTKNKRQQELSEDLRNNILTCNVRGKRKAANKPQIKSVDSEQSLNNLPSNFKPQNLKKRNKITNEPEINSVNKSSIKESSNNLQSKTVTQNPKELNVTKKLKRNFNTRSKKRLELSENLRNDLTYNKKRKAVNKPQTNFVDCNEQDKSLHNLQSKLKTCTLKKRNKIENELQTNFINKFIREESSADLQYNFRSYNAKKCKIANKPQTNFVEENIREESSDDFHSNIVTENINKNKNFIESQINFESNYIGAESVDQSGSNFATFIVANKEKATSDFQNTFVICTGEKEEENFQNNLIVHNRNLNETQTHLVSNDLMEESPKDLHGKLVSHNVKIKNISTNELENSFKIHSVKNNVRASVEIKSDHRTKGKTGGESYFPSITDTLSNIYDSRRDKQRKEELTTLHNSHFPTVEKLKYTVKSSPFCMKDSVSSVCVVHFKGANVLKGLQKLIDDKIIKSSLPDYLCEKPKTGKTEYVINL